MKQEKKKMIEKRRNEKRKETERRMEKEEIERIFSSSAWHYRDRRADVYVIREKVEEEKKTEGG